jgi:hypothetical protein
MHEGVCVARSQVSRWTSNKYQHKAPASRVRTTPQRPEATRTGPLSLASAEKTLESDDTPTVTKHVEVNRVIPFQAPRHPRPDTRDLAGGMFRCSRRKRWLLSAETADSTSAGDRDTMPYAVR